MRLETRRAAAAAATKRGQQMGEWMEGAVWDRVHAEAGGGVIPPIRLTASGLSAPSVPASILILDAASVASLLQSYVALTASAKLPPDKALVEDYAALLRELMRRMREAPRDPQ